MNKIYFAASIRAGRDDIHLYHQLIEHLSNYGKVLSEHIGNKDLSQLGDDGSTNDIHNKDMSWLNESSHIVAEVTTASLGVGYELGRIVERNIWVSPSLNKKILCLYRPQINRRLSAMIAGCDGIMNVEYQNLDEAKKAIDNFFKPKS